MSQSNQTNSYTDFYYHLFRNILVASLPLLIISALILSSLHSSAAELSSADSVNISIPTSCTLVNEVNDTHNASIINGRYVSDIGKSTITTYCNDENGYVVYAVGYGNNEIGNNKLVSSRSTSSDNYDIATGTATSGSTSNWAMKLTTTNVGNKVNNEYGYITNNDGDIVKTNQGTDTPVITSPYEEYTTIPSQWARVVTKPSRTVASTTGSSFSTTYAAYVSTTQPAGNYSGQVRYLIAHPYVSPNVYYMQDVATWKDELGVEDTALVIDKRDYKSYYVTKLKDGHIWMTQNLAIDLSYTDGDGNVTMRTFTSEDTDLNVIYDETTGNYAEYGGDGYTKDNDIISWTPDPTAQTSTIRGASAPDWYISLNTPYSAKKLDSPTTGHESSGNYYNWTAAIASNNSSSRTGSSLGDVSNNPKNSICPKGWRLPTISNQGNNIEGSTNEFGRLNFLYNDSQTSGTGSGAKLIESPLWLVESGDVVRGQLLDYNARGNYLSSTVYNNMYDYYLSFSNDDVKPDALSTGAGDGRGRGRSIRCLAR